MPDVAWPLASLGLRRADEMANKGKVLQTLVHAIETAVSGSPNVKVESPKRLRDKDTGRLREHDVVLTFIQAHHEFLLALECRDRSRPVGVPEVEAFHAKCLRTGIGRGLMVSSTGFRNTALTKAELRNWMPQIARGDALQLVSDSSGNGSEPRPARSERRNQF